MLAPGLPAKRPRAASTPALQPAEVPCRDLGCGRAGGAASSSSGLEPPSAEPLPRSEDELERPRDRDFKCLNVRCPLVANPQPKRNWVGYCCGKCFERSMCNYYGSTRHAERCCGTRHDERCTSAWWHEGVAQGAEVPQPRECDAVKRPADDHSLLPKSRARPSAKRPADDHVEVKVEQPADDPVEVKVERPADDPVEVKVEPVETLHSLTMKCCIRRELRATQAAGAT